MPDTMKVYQFGKAPGVITLEGDKEKAVEPAQHVIEFPGGSIELTRIEMPDGSYEYWAHIAANQQQMIPGSKGRDGLYGHVVGSRIDYKRGVAFKPQPMAMENDIQHVAIRISTGKELL